MKKRVLASLLASTMALSLLASCSSDSGSSSSGSSGSGSGSTSTPTEVDTSAVADGDPVTLSFMYVDNTSYPYMADWPVWDWITEGSNVILEPLVVPSADYTTKRDILMSSGDLPDIISFTFPSGADIASGVLLPISQYEDQMPNYKSFIDDNGLREEMDSKRSADGNYYMMPAKIHTVQSQPQQWIIRADIFEEHNIPVPTTLEEIYEAGLILKDLYPTATPITNRFGANTILQGISQGFGTLAGYADTMMYDYDTESWHFAPVTDEYRETLEYMNLLYSSGVLDAEFSTLDSPTYEQKIMQGETFIMYDWAMNIYRYEQTAQAENPDYKLQVIYPPTGSDDNVAVGWKGSMSQSWVLSADLADDPEKLAAALALIDWAYTDEAELLLTFGIEGETFEYTDNGVINFKDPEVDYYKTYGVGNNSLNVREHIDYLYGLLYDDNLEMMRTIDAANIIPLTNPASPLTVEEMEDSQVMTSNLKDYTSTEMEKFIFGSSSFDNWDAYVAECEAKGYKDMEALYAEAAARMS